MQRRESLAYVVFFFIAFGVPWTGVALSENLDLPFWPFACFCSIAGFAASFAEGGVEGLRSFCWRTLRVQGTLVLIVLALLTPLALGLLYMIGEGVSLSSFNPLWTTGRGAVLAMALVTGPVAEEFGWRGFLQNKLATRMRPFLASLVTGAVWCAWHLPLFYSSVFASLNSALGFLAFCVTWSVLLGLLVHRSQGSVWPAIALHWAANVHPNLLHLMFPSVEDGLLPGGSGSTSWYLFAALAFAAFGWRYYFMRPAPATPNVSSVAREMA